MDWTVYYLSILATRRSPIHNRPTVWLLAFNFVGFGITMPFYCILHILSRPVQTPTPKRPSDSTVLQWRLIPFSTALGYGIPTIIGCIPNLSPKTHRLAIQSWGVYPLFVLLTQEILFYIFSRSSVPTSSSSSQMSKPTTPPKSRPAPLNAYVFAISWSALTYIWTMSLLLTCIFFPSLFSPSAQQNFSLREFFIPAFPSGPGWEAPQVGSLVESLHTLLKWDILTGCWAACIWVVTGSWDARTVSFWSSPSYLLCSSVVWFVLFGFGE